MLEIFQTIIMIFGSVAVIIAVLQWKYSLKLQRTKFFNDMLMNLRFDRDIVKALYLVEHNEHLFDQTYYGNSANSKKKVDFSNRFRSKKSEFYFNEEEFVLDKLLAYLAYICYLIEKKNIQTKHGGEALMFHYVLFRVCISKSVQKYLEALCKISQKHNVECTYCYLIRYGEINGIFQTDGCNKNPAKCAKKRTSAKHKKCNDGNFKIIQKDRNFY